MKYIFILLLLVGCNDSKEVIVEEEIVYIDVGIDGHVIHGMDTVNLANGTIDTINSNSWVFSGFLNDTCINHPASRCNKVDIVVQDDYQNENVKYSFEFELIEYSKDYPPYYVIILQDWRPRDILDSIGRHPISTIKVKHLDGRPYLTHCENSWQWDYSFSDDDEDHSLHQENDCHGKYFIEVGVSVNIEFHINPQGASLVVNDKVISNETYKTKSNISKHRQMWGMYWDVNYNNENDPDKRIVIRIDNFKRFIYIN